MEGGLHHISPFRDTFLPNTSMVRPIDIAFYSTTSIMDVQANFYGEVLEELH